eukprot:353445-Chlamydomonas_euryale.AAC.3
MRSTQLQGSRIVRRRGLLGALLHEQADDQGRMLACRQGCPLPHIHDGLPARVWAGRGSSAHSVCPPRVSGRGRGLRPHVAATWKHALWNHA